ncbi:ComEA family DNA-binding protein [Brachybacterium paraconglomeratum]|uniref:ComEA family DNA-binding protein n=1 Tax=Brachybacterium paraconglomeratum TaxID=173362 RepID=UPI0022E58DC3|nr:ComEA family DNA-binding protein [Brachybacterium paraconglomeratum]
MGAPPVTEEPGTAARHRRTGQPLIRRRDHTAERPRRRLPFPAPPASALIGIAVLVLIGAGVIHLSGTGSAIPQEEPAGVTVVEGEAVGPEGGADGEGSDGAEGADDDGDADGGDGPTGDRAESSGGPAATDSSAPTELVVHVSGAVVSPGVVRLPPGARVDDALRAAGGATGEAELDAVNLARPVVDGEQIHVPVPGEEPPANSAPAPAADGPPAGDAGAGEGSAGGRGADGGLIDLNTASAAELDELPGVGPAIAQRIVDHREQNGPFESVDQLKEVSGIGPATLEKMRDRATV